MRHRVISALLLLASVANAQPDAMPEFAIKGYALGSELASCPGPAAPAPGVMAGATFCAIPEPTLGGMPVEKIYVVILDGRIIAGGAIFNDRGRSGGVQLLDALREKYGAPQISKSHVNHYTWRRGAHFMAFDGFAGALTIADTTATEALKAKNAKTGKNDL